MTESAVIFLPEMNDLWLHQCISHCEHQGYRWYLMLHDVDNVGRHLYQNGGGIVVVARPEHFRPVWLPRVEVVGDETRRISREVAEGVRHPGQGNPEPPSIRRAAPGVRRPNILR